MDLQQMRYAVAVAETNGFARAAERCMVVPSALSHQIARLERDLGVKLFERTSRRVRLTRAGEAFVSAARLCLDAADRVTAEVSAAVGDIRGRLSIGLIPTVTAVDIPTALRDFRQKYPDVRIGLEVGASYDLVEQVKDGAIDLAFLGLPVTAKLEGVAFHELARDRLVAVVAPDHPFAGEQTVTLRRLASEVFVDLPSGTAGRIQSDEAFAAAGLERDVAFEVTTADYIARLVAPGLCVAMLPAAYVPQLSGVVQVEVSGAAARVEYAIWGRCGGTPAAVAFRSILGIPLPPETGSSGLASTSFTRPARSSRRARATSAMAPG